MANTDPTEPFDPFEDDSAATARARVPAEASARPDWLVGPDDGVEAERVRREREAAAPTEAPALRRPTADPAPSAARANPMPLRLVPGAPAAPAAAAPVPEKKAWTAAASSLPTLRVVRGGGADGPTPTAPLDARLTVDHHALPEMRRAPAVPRPAPEEEDADAFPEDHVTPTRMPSSAGVTAARPVGAGPPHEAWWLVAMDALRSDRKAQVLAGLAVVLVAVLLFWPREEKTVALGEIRHHPASWNGRHVRVSGRIGEVFQVGGGFAFYLQQGHDTLVVFTRSRTPREQEKIVLSGTVSTGWLDGVPRPTLFEETTR